MAFNFQTFGTPVKEKPAQAGGFQFEGFGEEQPMQKNRGTIGKVAEFLAPTAVHTAEKLAAGEGIGFRDVAGSALEIGSFFIPVGAGVRGVGLAAKGIGLAGKAAARQAAKKTAMGLGSRTLQFAKGGAISGGMAGGGHAIGEGAGAGEVIERTAGGAAGGAAFAAALPGAGAAAGKVFGGAQKVTKSILGRKAASVARTAEEKSLLETGAADARIATKALQEGRIVTDQPAKEAVRQGIEEADVSFFKTMTRKDAAKGLQQLDIRQSQLRNRRELRRAMDVAGDTFLEKVAKPIQQLNKKAGERLEVVAEKLKGQKVDPTPAVTQLAGDLEKAGVTAINSRKLNFKNSAFEGLKPVQRTLTDLWIRANKIAKTGDAMLMHRTKRYIDELVEYGAEGKGLAGNAERISKGFRRGLDTVLDQNFKSYNQVNTVFADTIKQLEEMGVIIGKRFKVGQEFADSRAGLGLRRVLSNTQSRAEVLRILQGMQEVAKKYKINIDEDAISQAQFADILEKIIGSEAPTSLMGQTEKAVGIGAQAITSPIRAGIEATKHVYNITRGVNQENKIKAIREILKRIAGEVEPPPRGGTIGKPRAPKAPGGPPFVGDVRFNVARAIKDSSLSAERKLQLAEQVKNADSAGLNKIISEVKEAGEEIPQRVTSRVPRGTRTFPKAPGAAATPSQPALYHGTDIENVAKIQKEGFKVGSFQAHAYPQGVYFTTTKAEAQNYGELIKATTKLKPTDFFDISANTELRKLQGSKFVEKTNDIIRDAAKKGGVEIPKPSILQVREYKELTGNIPKDFLDISDIKTEVLKKLGYKGFVAPERGMGKEIIIFNPKDIITKSNLGKPKK